MTDERHEKALEAAFNVFDADGHQPDDDTIARAISAYLQAMDAVIFPRELSDDLLEEIHPAPYRAHERSMALRSHRLAQEFRKDEYRMLVSKAPNHFTNGE